MIEFLAVKSTVQALCDIDGDNDESLVNSSGGSNCCGQNQTQEATTLYISPGFIGAWHPWLGATIGSYLTPAHDRCRSACSSGFHEGNYYSFSTDSDGANTATCTGYTMRFLDDPSFGYYCTFTNSAASEPFSPYGPWAAGTGIGSASLYTTATFYDCSSPAPPSPPLPPIRPSQGAADRSYVNPYFTGGAGNGEQYIPVGSKCVEELTEDECRMYEERYAGHGQPSYAFQAGDYTSLPGPGCHISNQAVVFYYNRLTTAVNCGEGATQSNCVCVDKSPSPPPPSPPSPPPPPSQNPPSAPPSSPSAPLQPINPSQAPSQAPLPPPLVDTLSAALEAVSHAKAADTGEGSTASDAGLAISLARDALTAIVESGGLASGSSAGEDSTAPIQGSSALDPAVESFAHAALSIGGDALQTGGSSVGEDVLALTTDLAAAVQRLILPSPPLSINASSPTLPPSVRIQTTSIALTVFAAPPPSLLSPPPASIASPPGGHVTSPPPPEPLLAIPMQLAGPSGVHPIDPDAVVSLPRSMLSAGLSVAFLAADPHGSATAAATADSFAGVISVRRFGGGAGSDAERRRLAAYSSDALPESSATTPRCGRGLGVQPSGASHLGLVSSAASAAAVEAATSSFAFFNASLPVQVRACIASMPSIYRCPSSHPLACLAPSRPISPPPTSLLLI